MKHTGWLISGILSLIIVISAFKSLQTEALPVLKLNTSYAVVEQREYFDAGKYVAIAASETGRLILPVVDTSNTGRKAVIYRLENDMYTVSQILIVDIKKRSD